ncbi:phosphoglucosamine mutase [Tistrella bauzanensis]|uniref:Phosphoglucosamine mutase n=1 Tax=Tistrella bauzanensis TaxID=657419 RepID=A0ABQ1I8Z2_9PROT|nr:phosphoglucosamine mutase [Tistrella bauzanensis]GGB28743.1 phosphoglucosamine mutase [Tistrella bauzanensis]
MSHRYFGTDGIRGRANSWPMTAEVALRLGVATGMRFRSIRARTRVVIGKDTRLSGYMIEPALTAGFVSAGCDVILVGPIPTPAIAMLTRSMRCDLGVMISASHNPFADNGVKLFGPDGYKLSDEVQDEIEALMDGPPDVGLAASEKLGRARRLDTARDRYVEAIKGTLPRGLRLDGLKVAIDCANGAAYSVAPTILWELGADVTAIGVEPDGFNINRDCGSTAPDALARAVVEKGCDIGFALDGDADRVIVVDEAGRQVDGDQIMALIATSWAKRNRLVGGGIVATVMSNMGLERYLEASGLHLVRTQVGDRYVGERMRADGYNVGGEQSGHMIFSDYATTGDGLVAALQVLAVMVDDGISAKAATNRFEPWPQLLRNVRYAGQPPQTDPEVMAVIAAETARLDGHGRVLIRPSGTETLIRVMAEADDAALVESAVDRIVSAMEKATARRS